MLGSFANFLFIGASVVATPLPRPQVQCPALDESPQIDGVLSDTVWQEAQRLTSFTTISPVEGRKPSQETKVFIYRTTSHLYLAVEALDSEPEKVRARVARRDGIFSDDWVSVTLDPFNDARKGYLFVINPHGIQGDGIRSPSPHGDDMTWDAIFQSAGRRTPEGYTLEIAIPFSSIRFPRGKDTWGLNISRRIPRLGEEVTWSPVSQSAGGRLEQMGHLHNMSGILPRPTFSLIPEFTARTGRGTDTQTGLMTYPSENNLLPGEPLALDLGAAAKFSLGASSVLDAAWNPDFSQVEADASQITVNQRFALFFPEKRPFFLEGRELLKTPWEVVYTRSIVDPIYGVKFTGKWDQTSLAVLHGLDASPADSTLDARWTTDSYEGEHALNTVARTLTNLNSKTTLGALATQKQIGSSWNRVGGIDTNVRISDTWTLVGQALLSASQHPNGEEDSGGAVKARFIRSGRHWDWFSWYEELTDGFRAEVGFLPRVGYRETGIFTGYRFEVDGNSLVALRPFLAANALNSFLEGDRERNINAQLEFEYKTGSISAGYNTGQERYGGKDFPTDRASFHMGFQPQRWFSFSLSASGGKQIYYDPDDPFVGFSLKGSTGVTVNPTDAISTGISYGRDWLRTHSSGPTVYDAGILRHHVSWYWSPQLGFRLITDWSNLDDEVLLEGLISYQSGPATAFYLGYREALSAGPLADTSTDRAAFLKWSYLWHYQP